MLTNIICSILSLFNQYNSEGYKWEWDYYYKGWRPVYKNIKEVTSDR